MSTLGRTLHEKYGPVVRVGPNEVWFNSRDAFKAIYSKPEFNTRIRVSELTMMAGAGSGFEKSDFYRECANVTLEEPSTYLI